MAVRHGYCSKGVLLGKICGPNLENGVYRRRYNFELERKFSSSQHHEEE
jgi:hypothetical protein